MIRGSAPDSIAPVVIYAAALSAELADKLFILTAITRTDDEQVALLRQRNEQREADGLTPLPLTTKSVHQFWRGADGRTSHYTNFEKLEICRRINQRFKYGGGRDDAAVHRYGSAEHIHLQVPRLTPWGS